MNFNADFKTDLKYSKSQKVTKKDRLNPKKSNKSIKYASNQLLPEFWPIIKFNADSKYDFEIFKKSKNN